MVHKSELQCCFFPQENCPQLEVLDVSNCRFSGDHVSLDVQKFQTGCPKLRVLRLGSSLFRLKVYLPDLSYSLSRQNIYPSLKAKAEIYALLLFHPWPFASKFSPFSLIWMMRMMQFFDQ
jgi:hypothetical protein